MSNLPDLPRKNKRIEADVDSLVANKLVKVHPHKNWAMECKIKGGRLKTHQVTKLKQVENGNHPPQKIPDMGRQNNYDFYYLGDADAIVCVVDGRNVQCIVNSGVIKYDFRI